MLWVVMWPELLSRRRQRDWLLSSDDVVKWLHHFAVRFLAEFCFGEVQPLGSQAVADASDQCADPFLRCLVLLDLGLDGRADLLESGQRWCQVGALKALLDSQGVAVL